MKIVTFVNGWGRKTAFTVRGNKIIDAATGCKWMKGKTRQEVWKWMEHSHCQESMAVSTVVKPTSLAQWLTL